MRLVTYASNMTYAASMGSMVVYLLTFSSVFGIVSLYGQTPQPDGVADRCFCRLKGEVDDCTCDVHTVDSFNNFKIYPRINSLVQKNYFRYWNVNLKKTCPFWVDDSRCALKDCAVDTCSEDTLPDGLKENHSMHQNEYSEAPHDDVACDDNSLGYLNTTISDKSRKAFETWRKHDDAQDTFCELDDDKSKAVEYVDLTLNPERYTGYKGDSPHRVWQSIYKENCFTPETGDLNNYLQAASPGSALEGMCLEKRAFYRMVSGLHTSINIHLCAEYLFPDKMGFGPGKWGPNVKEFQQRFDPETTYNNGPQWLKNLYFTYLVEARALTKVAPYLLKESFYTGDSVEDGEVKEAVVDLLQVLKTFPNHFDESKLFQGDAHELKNSFKTHFRNISRIMDCVGCDKCKLWGKLQVTGMGTALKILFSGKHIGPQSTLSQKHKRMESPFQLRRQEIVALVNAFARLSKSIYEIEMFRERLRK